MKKGIITAIIVAAVAIPLGVYAAGPLFVNTTIDEPLPATPGQDDVMADDKGGMSGESGIDYELSGSFVGVGDGIHDASGQAKVIPLEEGRILRLEEFRATNGPDLYVYLSTDKQASEYVSLGKLKGNIGNQNYDIPEGTDLDKYGTVLIWCQQFSVLFGSAGLSESPVAA